MRLAYYAGASTAAAAACLLKAFHQRPNFYSATVYLSQSNACLLILTNLLLVLACSFMYGLQRLLYGRLRPIEIEQLSDKAWYAVLDTLLAMPSFREHVGGWLLTMFVLLLAGKVWGWIGEGRVDILEQQPPANPRLFHARLATSLTVSLIFDIAMLHYCVETVVSDPRPGMMVIFTFEYAILGIFSAFTLARYALTLVETAIVKKQTLLAIEARKSEIRGERAAARQAQAQEGETTNAAPPADDEPIEVDENEVDVPGWEEKRRYLFALEVLTDFIKLVVYIVFFTVSITFNGLPMHIMRDVYLTFASFSKRVTDYVAYRKATSDMNTRYPDATTEEIRGDACIVCRETMVAWEQPTAGGEAQPAGEQGAAAPRRRDEGLRAKKLPCGHILHLRCLKAWLERQQVCPTCRRPVIAANAPATGAAAAGGNAGPQGQQGGQQQRQPRARIFNFGPLRVGFLNAPNNQMQNILNQIQNPDGANQHQNQNQNQAGGNGQQQGPNHLGLQVPYVNDGNGGQSQQGVAATSRGLNGLRSGLPMHVQFMQLEQRIMQEALSLNLHQQQLLNLRAMEAEATRLRSQHAQQRQGQSAFVPHQPPTYPLGVSAWQPPPLPTMLSGNPSQQLSNGHESLPEGLVLPEGWTAMPLQRVPTLHNPHPQPQQDQTQPSGSQGSSTSTAAASTEPTATTALETSQHDSTSQTGPTDDNGSPLFVPAEPSTEHSNGAVHEHSNGAAPEHTNVAAPEQKAEAKAPWTAGESSWGFGGAANNEAGASASANGSAEGKGKAKAAKVEDVPDEESKES